MTTVRVLMLEAASPESTALAETATARGYQVHAATDPDLFATYNPTLRKMLTGYLLTDFSQPEQPVEVLIGYARRIGADAVLTTNEYLTPLAAEICAALDLPGNDPALATAARNKVDMIDQFTRCGVTAPRTHVVSHENELLRLVAAGQLAFPCIIKPADGAGSAGVTVVTCAAEAGTAIQATQEPRGMYGMVLDERVVVQELVEGTEYSVESFTQGGRSTHLCLTRKIVTGGAHRIELGHGLPAVLPVDTEHIVYKQVELAIAAIGMRNGATHTEVIVTPDGQCTVIEISARIGAGQIGFLIQHALGIDPWTACLDTALGHPARLAPTRSGYATVRFLTAPHPGWLAAVTGLPGINPQVPIVRMRKAVGEAVSGAKDNTDRIGSFVAVGHDQQSVDNYADHLMSRVRIVVEPIEPGQNGHPTGETPR